MPTDTTDTTGNSKRAEAPWAALIDGIADANRLAHTHAEELRRLQVCVIFSAILMASIYVLRGTDK